MITEKSFALSHAAFWEQLIPMAKHYIRRQNSAPGRYLPPLVSWLAPGLRGLVNEIGFRIFAESFERNLTPSYLSDEVIQQCVGQGINHISYMRQYARRVVPIPGEQAVLEARRLAGRLTVFFEKAKPEQVQVFPRFPGCGWLDECQGDVLAKDILFEVKAGARTFRSVDIRQMLCYCALSFASKRYEINEVCLVNPRMGTYFLDSLENMCRQIAGQPAVEVLAALADYVSEPSGRYWTG